MKNLVKFTVTSLVGLACVQGSYALTVDTPTGKQTLPDNPQRIVILDLGAADNLVTLGQQNRVVGIVDSKFFPAYLKTTYTNGKFKNVGTLVQPDLEAIANLNPDLIIVSGRQVKIYDQLKQIAPIYNVSLDNVKPYESIVDNFKTIAQLTGTENKAKELLTALDKKVEALKAQTSNQKALVVLVNDRKMSGFGEGSRFSLVYKFGFTPAVNIGDASSRHGTELNYELINKADPRFLFVVDRTAALSENKGNARDTLDNDLVKATSAGKNNGIVYLNSVVWYLAFGGYQGTTEIVDELSTALKNSK
ncbi:siderophore ABC transporter substrate-binding protein [Psittacicella hinzii]|uniref:Fe/B12 periplasmic-binding domain-containing protein n=1 Tax=Psittacicella hinzii TaxID=2028575 RepID=A0A3A1YJB3_9GAMM|nr:ABC transporter substrate-binding protein [Psittacicella hinzii]RIY37526.1 hypothetical protein CKF58_04765 [Psittacicella hinzii]